MFINQKQKNCVMYFFVVVGIVIDVGCGPTVIHEIIIQTVF